MRDARVTEIKFRGYRPNVGLNFSYANKNYSKVLNESHSLYLKTILSGRVAKSNCNEGYTHNKSSLLYS